MNMEFININLVNTTTLVTVTSGTSTVERLFDRETFQYQSSGFDSDATVTTLSVVFPSTQTVDRIALQNHNLKDFELYYDSNSANKFSLSIETTSSDWTSNSATNSYLILASATAIKTLQIVASATIDANEEKKIGELWVTDLLVRLEHNPPAGQYKPKYDRKEYVHEMSDGGTAVYVVDKYFTADIGLSYQSDSMTTGLLDIYNTASAFVFVPYPTTTGWRGDIFEVNWIGDYDFLQPAKNDYTSYGWKGTVKLRETPK